MTVGIFGQATDDQVRAVAAALTRAGCEPVVLRLDRTEIASWRWTPGSILREDGTDLMALDAVYVRSVTVEPPRHRSDVVAPADEAAWLEAAGTSLRWLGSARAAQASMEAHGVRMVNPVASFWFHRSKPGADQRLADAGIAVPRGLVTSDPEAVRSFVDEVGSVVHKPVAGGGACRLLDPSALGDDALAGLGLAPVLFQEHVPGRDLRVYVAAGEVIGACVIETDAIDYRGNETGIEVLSVDDDLSDLCVRAATALGMVFSGIDVKEGPDGRRTVLDVNPSPMFAGIDAATGLDIAGRLAACLLDR